MKQILILLTLVTSVAINTQAQTAEDSVKMVINKMFEAMKNGDAVLLTQAFADSAIFQTIVRNKEGKTIVRTEQVKGFIEFVGKQQKGAADERITFETIKIDGPLAIAWTPYQFYYNGQFSHCGTNSFQLVRQDGKWKIQYLIDTRRKDGCE